MKNTAVVLWLLFLAAAVSGYGLYTLMRVKSAASASSPESAGAPAADEEAEMPPPFSAVGFTIHPFELTNSKGEKFASKSLDGQVWIASFFFTRCPGPCTTLNQTLAQLAKEMPQENVQLVSISVDPQNDTPAVLTNYAMIYGADTSRWHFLTGEEDQIRHVAEHDFKLAFAKVTHSTRLVLVNSRGQVDGYYDSSDARDLVRLKKRVAELQPAESAPATGAASASSNEAAE